MARVNKQLLKEAQDEIYQSLDFINIRIPSADRTLKGLAKYKDDPIVASAITNLEYLNDLQRVKDLEVFKPYLHELYTKKCSDELRNVIQKILNSNGAGVHSVKQFLDKAAKLGFMCGNVQNNITKKKRAIARPQKKAVTSETDYDIVEDGKLNITLDTAWDPWQLQVIKGNDYQQFVREYVKRHNLDFVNTDPLPNRYLCLIAPKKEYGTEIEAFERKYGSLLVPCRIIVTTKVYDEETGSFKDEAPNYAIAIHWDLKKFYKDEIANDEDLRADIEDYINNGRYEMDKQIGFIAYDFTRKPKGVLNEIKKTLIDPVENDQDRKCHPPNNSLVMLPKPQYLMQNVQLLKSYIIADTHHDFGLTTFQRMYIDEVLMDGEFKTVLEKYEKAESADGPFISTVLRRYLSSDTPVLNNPQTYEDYGRRVTQEMINSFQIRSIETNQEILDQIAKHLNAGIFVNRGGSQNIFDPSQQRICAATRLEGTMTGKLVESNDTGYGFSKDELMYFDQVFVNDGNIYFQKGDFISKLPYSTTCVPNKSIPHPIVPLEKGVRKNQKHWLVDCLCKLPSMDDYEIAKAFYDVKRVADGLVIKATLHHNGVMLSHDKMAVLGARLYGCPVILERGGVVRIYPHGSKHSIDLNNHEEDRLQINNDPITPNQTMSEYGRHTLTSSAAENAQSGIIEAKIRTKRKRDEDNNQVEQVIPRRPRIRMRAPEPPENRAELDKQARSNYIQEKSKKIKEEEEAIKRHKEELFALSLYYGITDNKGEDMTGGGPLLTINNPSDDLMGCLMEILVLRTSSQSNTSKRDFVAEVFEKFAKSDIETDYVDGATAKKIEASIVESLRMAYAKRFGIVTPADHAYRVFMDPHLSNGYTMDYPYYNKLMKIANRATPVQNISSVTQNKRKTVKSAPVVNAARIMVPSKPKSANDATTRNKKSTKAADVQITVNKPVTRQSGIYAAINPTAIGMAR